MTTATMPAVPAGLWLDARIPIIMLSGSVNSGKTIFALDIDPNCRRQGTPPTTISWDQEGSASSYEGALNFYWRDIRAAVFEGVHLKVHKPSATDPKWRKILLEKADVNDYPAASMFRAWYLDLLTIEKGQYRVGIADTFTPLQEGLIEWLRMHPEAFGRTANQYDKAASMFLWPDIKAVLSHILTTDCRLRFETFVMNVHLKNEWKHGGKTGQKVAEGLDVLEKIASLHIELDRTPPAKGKEAPRVPKGIVRKERLIRFGATSDDDKPILPPHMDKATPAQIREYIANPPDFEKLKPAERMPEEVLTDDEKLLIQADIARNNAEAATAELSRVDRMKLAAQRVAQARGEQIVESPVTQQDVDSGAATEAAESSTPASEAQLGEIKQRWKEIWSTPAEFSAYLKSAFNVAKPTELSEPQATALIFHICEQANAKLSTSAESAEATEQPTAATTTPPPVAANAAGSNGQEFATREQLIEIKRLSELPKPDGTGNLWSHDQQVNWLKRQSIQSFRSLPTKDADDLIVRLANAAKALSVSEGTPGN